MANDRQLANTPMSNPADLKRYLESAKEVIKAALPKHLNPERMLRLALTQFSTTPKLRECTPISILGSLVIASQLGLEPGIAGQGYLIPYKGTCTFVPGWRGLVGLLNNTGRATAYTGAVFTGDDFEFELGSRQICKHIPRGESDPQKLEWAYAIGWVNGAQHPVIEAWPAARIWRHRDRFNKVGPAHYSFQHPEMYARKVVLLQVLKYMPCSIEMANAMTAAEAAEMNRSVTVQDGVVIDMEEAAGIPGGNVGGAGGASMTEMIQGGGAPAGGAQEKPAKSGAPTSEELLAEILKRGCTINAGKAKLKTAIVAMKLMEPAEALEKLPADRLATIIDAWGEIADSITNPGEPA